MILGRVKFRYSICLSFFVALFLLSGKVCADTIFEDIEVKLGIETGSGLNDYADADLVIAKGTYVEYTITVTNNGDLPHSGVVVQMDIPDYMVYSAGSVYFDDGSGQLGNISDIGILSGLQTGYVLNDIYPGQSIDIYAKYQVQVPENIKEDPVYTLAWASVWDIYSGIPKLSQAIENPISGEAIALVKVTVTADPESDAGVYTGYKITYTYTLRNVGGLPAKNVFLTLTPPVNTRCEKNADGESTCGNILFPVIQPNESVTHEMIVTVLDIPTGIAEIVNTGYDLGSDNFKTIQNREAIVHIVDPDADPQEGDFRVIINQVPNIVLNSPDGITQRIDEADLTETQYTLIYSGRKKDNTYFNSSRNGLSALGPDPYTIDCGSNNSPRYVKPYYNVREAFTYAYNSTGGGCDNFDNCQPVSSPLVFNVNTILPGSAPKLIFANGTTSPDTYEYGSTSSEVSSFMYGPNITLGLPEYFTISRAIENGAQGFVETTITANVSEDLYRFTDTQIDDIFCYYTVCGEDACESYPRYYDIYRWMKTSEIIGLTDTDSTNISVYTSTAWLKTEGGHIGTNSMFTNEAGTFGSLDVNLVDLPFYEDINSDDDNYYRTNEFLKENHPTSSSEYTPPGEFNAEYMVFGNLGIGDMKTSCGQNGESDCEDWFATDFTPFKNENEGTSFVQKGDAYDRVNNPRNYEEDLLIKKKFGEVRTDGLPPNPLVGNSVELGDNIIWNYGDANITIGSDVDDDVVVFSGGQSRIYTTGDVYIRGDIKYKTSKSSDYNSITSVRIDARNIYVDGEVEDLEVMLLARGEFHSGVSKKQLRILGDVIAKNTFWEREPLLEFSPEEFNKPSEYIIEDMRKYVVPAPGDTEVPDDYTIWRQVNPATGEVLDGY